MNAKNLKRLDEKYFKPNREKTCNKENILLTYLLFGNISLILLSPLSINIVSLLFLVFILSHVIPHVNIFPCNCCCFRFFALHNQYFLLLVIIIVVYSKELSCFNYTLCICPLYFVAYLGTRWKCYI